jgi:hypothetical protein
MVGVPAYANAASPQIDQRTCSPNDPTPQIEFYNTNAQYGLGGDDWVYQVTITPPF